MQCTIDVHLNLHELGNQLRKAITELPFAALKETSVHAFKNSSFSPTKTVSLKVTTIFFVEGLSVRAKQVNYWRNFWHETNPG